MKLTILASILVIGGLLLQAARIEGLKAKLELCRVQWNEVSNTNAELAKLLEEQNKAVELFKDRVQNLQEVAEEVKQTQEEAERQAEAMLQDAARVASSLTSEVDLCKEARNLLVQPVD